MLLMPMSSPKMTRMFGFFCWAAAKPIGPPSRTPAAIATAARIKVVRMRYLLNADQETDRNAGEEIHMLSQRNCLGDLPVNGWHESWIYDVNAGK